MASGPILEIVRKREDVHRFGQRCDNALNMPTNFWIAATISPSSRRRDGSASGRARRRRTSSCSTRHNAVQTIYRKRVHSSCITCTERRTAYIGLWFPPTPISPIRSSTRTTPNAASAHRLRDGPYVEIKGRCRVMCANATRWTVTSACGCD